MDLMAFKRSYRHKTAKKPHSIVDIDAHAITENGVLREISPLVAGQHATRRNINMKQNTESYDTIY